MTRTRTLALALTASLAALSLASCKGGDGKGEAAASAAPDAKPGVTIKDARLVLPAVAGNPGAAYFVLDNQSKNPVAIGSVTVQGAARTEIHSMSSGAMTKIDLAKAEPSTHLDFKPGDLHVMVFDVSADLKAGNETEITVTFADGDKVSVPAKIEAAGDAAMGGMKMDDHN